MKKFIFIIFFITGLFVVQPISALTISPPIKEFTIERGTEISDVIKLINEEDSEKTFYTSVEGFKTKNEGGEPMFFATTDKAQLATWITVDSKSVTLKPKEEKEIKYTIKVPENASTGGQYAAIFWSSQPPETSSEVGIGVVAKIGALILVTIPGEIKEEMQVIDFSTPFKFFSRLPVKFTIDFENSGNIHLKPKGIIKITPKFLGIGKGELKINDIEGNILPQSVRKFELTWIKKFVQEKKTKNLFSGFVEELKNEWNNFAIGYFEANLFVVFGQTEPKYIEKTYNFWVIPWMIVLLVLLLAIIILFILRIGIKKYNQWIIKKYQKNNL